MAKFKVVQKDINNKVLRSDIVIGKSKFDVEQLAAKQIELVKGQALPSENMQSDTFYITVIPMNIL